MSGEHVVSHDLGPSASTPTIVRFFMFPIVLLLTLCYRLRLYYLPVNFQGCKADINNRKSNEPGRPVPVPSLFPNESVDATARASPPALIDPDILLSPLLEDSDDSSISLPMLDSGQLALRRLVSHGVIPKDELHSIIKTIVSNMKAADIVKYLKRSDTQRFIDVMDEVCYNDSSSGNMVVAHFMFTRR